MTEWLHQLPPNATDISQILRWVNSVTDNTFGSMTLISIFAISFIALKRYEFEEALTGSLTITSIIGILLYTMELISDFIVIGLIVSLVLTIFALISKKRNF